LLFEAPDATLLRIAEQLRLPVLISTERFGDLVLDPRLGWFEGKARWNRRVVDIHFGKDAEGGISNANKAAEALWSEQATWQRKIDDYVVDKLLALKNDTWLEDGETKVTPEEFRARMELKSVNVDDAGRFTFWHVDGDLFWGHWIEVRGNLKDGIRSASIAG